MDELLDIAAVAKYLGVSERTVYNHVRSGTLPAAKVGRLWRVRASDLEAWIGAGRTRPVVPGLMVAEGGPTPSRAELERAVDAFEDRIERRLAFAGVLSRAYEVLGWPVPVVVGGHAVEFWTAGGYATAGIDMAGPSEPAEQILAGWDFERQGRHWFDETLGIVVEIPGSSLSSGALAHTATVRMGGYTATVLGVEDLIVDRLCACKHWNDEESCMWAEALLASGYDLDEEYLRERATAEDVLDRLESLREGGVR